MKKTIVFLFLLTNVLLFFRIKAVYEEADLHFISNPLSHSEEVLYHHIMGINNEENALDSRQMAKVMDKLVADYGLTISMTAWSDGDLRRNVTNYFASSVPLDELLGLVTNVSLTFNFDSSGYYTNQLPQDENGVHFYLLNRKLRGEFVPFSAMGENLVGGDYSFSAPSQENLREAVALFEAEFEPFIGYSFEMGASSGSDEAGTAFGLLDSLLWVCLGGTFLILVMYIYQNSKKISIFKTQGFSMGRILINIMAPLFTLVAVTVLGTLALLFGAFVGAINGWTLPMLQDLAVIGTVQILGVALLAFISSLLLKFVPTYSLLKNSNLNRYLMNVNFVMKVLVVVVSLPVLNAQYHVITEAYDVIRNTKPYDDFATFQNMEHFQQPFIADGYDLSRYANEYYEEGDRNIIHKYERLGQYHEAYHLLNEQGALLSKPTGFWGGQEGLLINQNYLQMFPIKDEHGEVVDVSKVSSERVYLIPKSLEGKQADFIFEDEGTYEVIIIDDFQETLDLTFWMQRMDWNERPYVLIVLMDNAFEIDFSPRHYLFLDGDFNEALRGTSFYDRMVVYSIGQDMSMYREINWQIIGESLMVALPLLLLLVVIIAQYAYLFVQVYRQRIFIRKMIGYGVFRNFGRLLIESLVAIVIASLVAYFQHLNVTLLLVVVLLDVLVYLAVVALQSWRKGESV